MRLEFSRPHRSIKTFPTIEVPQLSVVVGINGSGKSHLLQAIENGSIGNSISPVPASPNGHPPPMHSPADGPVKLLTLTGPPSDFKKNYQGEMQPGMGRNTFDQQRQTVLQPFLTKLDALTSGKISRSLVPGEDIWRIGCDEAVRRSANDTLRPDIQNLYDEVEKYLKEPWAIPPQQSPYMQISADWFESINNIAEKLNIARSQVDGRHEQNFGRWRANQFENNLPTLFGKYRDALVSNRLLRQEDESAGTTNAYSDEEFIQLFGDPPWDQISRTFQAIGLPYKAVAPNKTSFGLVHFELARTIGGEIVDAESLSSGEKILLNLALSSYEFDPTMVTLARPKILLLDELDAPLHPEMLSRWLKGVENGLVKQQGMYCIITTHSPTTIALVPEDSIYEMSNGFDGLRKIGKQQALNKLTYGVPTLSIDFLGRRQVFTESDTDASIFETIYSIAKPHLQCRRELNFLSTGKRHNNIDHNTGCSKVKHLVEQLTAAGSTSVFGIIDWDGRNTSTDRIFVLGQNSHDGIENLILDPVLIGILLLKEQRAPVQISDIARFSNIQDVSGDDLQRIADVIQDAVGISTARPPLVSKYINGKTISVRSDYSKMDDHDLESKLVGVFPVLKKYSGRGSISMAVVNQILFEYPGFCPAPFKEVFEAIGNAD